MDYSFIISNAFKGNFLLIKTTKLYPTGKELEDLHASLQEHKILNKYAIDDLVASAGITFTVEEFDEITDDHEYVLLVKSPSGMTEFDYTSWDNANKILHKDHLDNAIIAGGSYDIMRVKRILLPFL